MRRVLPAVVVVFEVTEDGAKIALSRAAAAQPFRLHHLSRHLTARGRLVFQCHPPHEYRPHARSLDPRSLKPVLAELQRTNRAVSARLSRRNRRPAARPHASMAARISSRPTPPQARRGRSIRARRVRADAATLAAALGLRPDERALADDRSRAASSTSCRASRSKTSASISRTATAIGRMPKRTATPHRPLRRSPPVSQAARCRHSSASASSRCRTSCTRAACARSTCSSRRSPAPTGGRLPANFVVTIPKLMAPGHVAAVARACAALERRAEAAPGTIALELMIETPQSILAPDGTSALRALVAAGGGRVTRRAFRHLRLHRALRHHRRPGSTCGIRPATSPST